MPIKSIKDEKETGFDAFTGIHLEEMIEKNKFKTDFFETIVISELTFSLRNKVDK